MCKKVLVINGNPKSKSYCHELAQSYITASEKNDVRLLNLSKMDFDINLVSGYEVVQPLEPDLQHFQSSLLWADHVVFIFPLWWGGMPAKLKGLIDRTFLPNFAFKFEAKSLTPQRLLKGRTAELIVTMDSPPFYYRWIYGDPIYKQMKRTILGFSGFEKVSKTYIGPIINATEDKKSKWNQRVAKLAKKVA
ncbi:MULTISPECIES: NAD(P)H-dependent oxidoreductase [unclassified Photobacterium]|uniref:NAD(P)H-dependent oxidoreductase n=1 Tax=unclassified Photobacterium TaxID=2628852 RepID=UPI001EDF5EA0|nr:MULTISPECIES: NAD(P)H-dependent oxidoreductase [unclassified Photobacterium]MCG3864734.1 NAD(P)H-dependent oxidoreductase [Photobacterium sp. Ph6]MCG3876143.1 NAD(P)H-dependent oxidoreductase [Photobacterium sp. Ph5]